MFALLGAALLSAAALQPLRQVALDPSCGDRVHGVAWASDDELLLASMSGVTRLALRRRSCATFIPGQEPPAGLPNAFNVASDGRTAVAFGLPVSQFAARVADGRRLFARRSADFIVSDIAVHGRTLYVLGFRGFEPPRLPAVAVWRGPVSAKWAALAPLHRLTTPAALDIFRHSIPTLLGALAVEDDGTIDIVTAAEAGVFRYRADGAALPPLGAGLSELVIKRMPELYFHYRTDELGRYRQVLNLQPIADDLIVTPDGPAILVRRAAGDVVRWELWYPDGRGRTAAVVPLARSRKEPAAHMRCDARGRRMACVEGGSLLLFALPKIAR